MYYLEEHLEGQGLEVTHFGNYDSKVIQLYNNFKEKFVLKPLGQRQSQDGGVGRHGVSVSPQLGCLPANGGRL